jgi:uncharacterized protein (DUF2249 family)
LNALTHIKGVSTRVCQGGAVAPISKFLDTHHEQIEADLGALLHVARVAQWPAYRRQFAELRATVFEHMAYEEQELFPELARALGSEVEVRELRSEHERLRRHFETLGAAAPEYDPEGCIGELEDLSAFVRRHHAKELQTCYPALDRLPGVDAGLAQGARELAGAARARSGAGASSPALDLRGLQPPEPIVRILAALERSPGDPLRAILPHEPVPLYALLQDRGFRYEGATRPDGGYELLIQKA